MNLLHETIAGLRRLFTRDIWRSDVLNERTARGRFYATLRVLSMTWSGVFENSLASRAGALSYSSMLGFAPLVLLAVLVSGVILQRTDPDYAVDQIYRGLTTIAPQIGYLTEASPPKSDTPTTSATDSITTAPPTADSSKGAPTVSAKSNTTRSVIAEYLSAFIKGSYSKAIGVTGAIALIIIVIQLFSSIESAFNDIWGVKRGRNLVLRIVFYWTAVTLGAVIVFAAITLQSAASVTPLMSDVPMGPQIRNFLIFLGPLISGATLIGILTLFYKFIPNTNVGWLPSLTGATIVVLLIHLNNFLAFLYIKNVTLNVSLYGKLAVPLVLMLGLYIFWLLMLVGGQITYAIQNANYRSSQLAWSDLNHIARRGIGLLVFTLICRRFRECRTPYTAMQLADMVRIPTQILNACLQRLDTLDLVSRVPIDEAKASQEYSYQPARPLGSITLIDFKRLFEGFGAGPSQELLDALDPVVRHFHQKLDDAAAHALGDETLESFIDRLPLDSLPSAALVSATAPANGAASPVA